MQSNDQRYTRQWIRYGFPRIRMVYCWVFEYDVKENHRVKASRIMMKRPRYVAREKIKLCVHRSATSEMYFYLLADRRFLRFPFHRLEHLTIPTRVRVILHFRLTRHIQVDLSGRCRC